MSLWRTAVEQGRNCICLQIFHRRTLRVTVIKVNLFIIIYLIVCLLGYYLCNGLLLTMVWASLASFWYIYSFTVTSNHPIISLIQRFFYKALSVNLEWILVFLMIWNMSYWCFVAREMTPLLMQWNYLFFVTTHWYLFISPTLVDWFSDVFALIQWPFCTESVSFLHWFSGHFAPIPWLSAVCTMCVCRVVDCVERGICACQFCSVRIWVKVGRLLMACLLLA